MALVLTMRTIDGAIHIGDDIEIELISINGGQAKLAFYAPEDVVIDRHSVWLSKQREKEKGND